MLGAAESFIIDISLENILVPIDCSKLTGGLTSEDRRGTLIDWNLCFTADGMTSGRNFRSGTAAFMAPILLEDDPIPRRTLAHDMESYFAVILWIASFDYEDSAAFQAKPLARILLNRKKDAADIANAKFRWFGKTKFFRKLIIHHFQPFYRVDERFLNCLQNLRRILYQDDDDDDDDDDDNRKEMEVADDDPMKEDLFRKCMKEIDDYLEDTKGSREIQWINDRAGGNSSVQEAGGNGSVQEAGGNGSVQEAKAADEV